MKRAKNQRLQVTQAKLSKLRNEESQGDKNERLDVIELRRMKYSLNWEWLYPFVIKSFVFVAPSG